LWYNSEEDYRLKILLGAGVMLTKNDLLVLGLLLDRPMHGYEINQYVQAEGVTTWFNISTAAIYYSLNKLRRQSLVSETRARSGGAEKSVYHVTERGREQFFAGMEAALASEEPVRFEYDLGIFLLNKLPQARALALMERRLDFLRRWHTTLEETLERERAARSQPLRVAILEHAAACVQVESEWLSGIIRQTRGEEVGERRGLMLLTGDLRDFHLPDLIKLIVSGKHSGTLTVTDGVSARTLSIHEGRPVCATSRRADGEIHDPDQVLNDIYDLFRWQEGAFTFDQRMEPQEGCLVLRISAENLILAGSRWVDNWTTIQRVIPSPDTVFERQEGPATDLDLTEDERQVFDALDGLKDVTTVARECGLTEFETSKILYGFHAVGLVQPGDRDKIRLRRLFREFAELMCRGTRPYRSSPDDVGCEVAVNQRCAHLPVRLITGRIEDHTDPALRTDELAKVYQDFLKNQRAVVKGWFGEEVAERLFQQVLSQISPGLRDVLEQYNLV
jgi:DNA-binding PadR family transcriptional regulator